MPTKAEKPAPNRLSARPVAYWLVLSQITSTPNAAASTAPATRAGAEREPVVAGVDGGREAGDGGDQHHPFGAEVDDAGALVDEQAERREREHGARVERGGDEERELVHQAPFRAGRVVDATTGLSGASSSAGVTVGATRDGCQRTR